MSNILYGSKEHQQLKKLVDSGNTYQYLEALGFASNVVANFKRSRWRRCLATGCRNEFVGARLNTGYCSRACSGVARSEAADRRRRHAS